MSRRGAVAGVVEADVRRWVTTVIAVLRPAAAVVIAILAVLAASPAAAAAATVEVRAARHPTHARLVLDWPGAVSVERRSGDDALRLRFDRAFAADFDRAMETLERHVETLEIGSDGRSLTIGFRRGFGVREMRQYRPDLIAIDIAERGPPVPASTDDSNAPPQVRIGTHDGYQRLVFEFAQPVQHRVERGNGAIILTFDRPAEVDAVTLGRQLRSSINELAALNGREGVRVRLRPGVEADVFGLGDDLVVIDFHQSTVGQADRPETAAVETPALTGAADGGSAIETTNGPPDRSDHAHGVSEDTSSDLGAPSDALPAGLRAGDRINGSADERAPDTGSAWPALSADITRRGVEISVEWPDLTSAAVFRRGGHLWMVFDAPPSPGWRSPPFDPLVERHLGRFDVLPDVHTEGENEGEWTVLRAQLHHPLEPEVTRTGSTWKIVLTADARPPDFVPVRRRPDPAELRIEAQGPREARVVADPGVGDRLLVWPLATPGLGAVARDHVEVALLPTAQGSVLRPLADELVTRVDPGALVVAARGGLNLSALDQIDARGGGSSASVEGPGNEGAGQAASGPTRDMAARARPEPATERVADLPQTEGERPSSQPVQANRRSPSVGSSAGRSPPVHVNDAGPGDGVADREGTSLSDDTLRADADPPGSDDRISPPMPDGPTSLPAATRSIGLTGWALGEGETIAGRRAALMRRVSDASEGARPLAQLDLARFFLAQAMAAETLAVIETLDDEHLEDAGLLMPARQGLTGAAELLMGRLQSAAEALRNDDLDRDPEIALWRAALAAAQHQWDRAARELGRSEDTLASYPPALRLRLGLPAAMISIETGRTELAFATLDRLVRLDLHPADRARLRFIRGLAHARVGQVDDAIALWEQVERMADEETRIKAAFAITTTLFDRGRIGPEDAMSRLDPLRPLWRGHAWEPSMLDRAAGIQLDAADPVAAIHTWLDVAARHPAAAERMAVSDKVGKALERALAGPGEHPLEPVRALALIEDQPDLLPPGEEGHRLRLALARRLAEIDLVDAAIRVASDASSDRWLDPAAGALLASLHLRARHPETSLEVLDETDGSDLDDAVRAERARIRAQAHLDLGRLDRALAAVRTSDDPASAELEAEILWRSRDWSGLSEVLRDRLAGADRDDDPLTRSEQEAVVRLAFAYGRMGADHDLARHRARFAGVMDDSALDAALDLAAAPRQKASDPDTLLAVATQRIEATRAFLDR